MAAIGDDDQVHISDALAVIAASWGVLMAASPILQIRRMVERRSSDDLSLSYFSVLMVGFTVWAAYGISLGNLAIIVPNSVAFLIGLATIVIALRYRSGPV
jgi:MtN3 and saliva related transmembrane protein